MIKNFQRWSYLLAGIALTIILIGCDKEVNSPADIVKDIDGNVYHAVTIGTQTWMVENLKTTKYNDGTDIPIVKDSLLWAGLSTPGYCWYNNDGATYKATYGALYNWYAVNTDKLCPIGWHVPSEEDWFNLTDYLGTIFIAGGKLKESGTTHWASPNTSATNETGFTALPGGYRTNEGAFFHIGYYGFWWSSSESEWGYEAYCQGMGYDYNDCGGYDTKKESGFSVRCLKD